MKRKIQRWMKIWPLVWLFFFPITLLVGWLRVVPVLPMWVCCLLALGATAILLLRLAAWQLDLYRPPRDITFPKFPSYDRILGGIALRYLVFVAVCIFHGYELIGGGRLVAISGFVSAALAVEAVRYICARIHDSLLPSLTE
jgi:hypothetical protein